MSSLQDLKELMHTCVEIGYLRAQKDMLPQSDKLRKRDAENLLVSKGLQKVLLSRWVSEGILEEHRGEKNSPIWYSLTQIMEIVCALRYRACVQ